MLQQKWEEYGENEGEKGGESSDHGSQIMVLQYIDTTTLWVRVCLNTWHYMEICTAMRRSLSILQKPVTFM